MACFVLGKWGLAYFFETLHLREDEDERNEAEHGEGRPYNVKRYLAPEEGGDNGEEVTHCGGDKPTTHHHTLVLGRSHLRNEGDTHRRKEQLGEGEDEVSEDQPTGRNEESALLDLTFDFGFRHLGHCLRLDLLLCCGRLDAVYFIIIGQASNFSDLLVLSTVVGFEDGCALVDFALVFYRSGFGQLCGRLIVYLLFGACSIQFGFAPWFH